MKTRSQWVFAAALSSVLAMGSAFAADDKAPIKIVTNNWTSQVVCPMWWVMYSSPKD